MHCPLCRGSQLESFEVTETPVSAFWHCVGCDYIFKDPSLRLSAPEEKERYEEHNNGDEGHQRFLQPVLEAVRELLPVGSRGLDWGSGPVPIFSEMLTKAGYPTQGFDPFFQTKAPKSGVDFDFITMTEVIEHVFEPNELLEHLRQMIKAGGYLVVMTERHQGVASIGKWYYRRDPTHVGFFSEKTFQKFAELFGLEQVAIGPRWVAFQAPAAPENL